MQVRYYEPGDRAAVRSIAADTADAGGPVENIFPDRELFMDLMTRYYTDFEPGSAWVAVVDDHVVGYLTGCLHPSRFATLMALRIVPAGFPRVICSAKLLIFMFRNFPTWSRSLFHRGPPWPKPVAHLHINVLDGHRGAHAGAELLAAFFEQARAAGMKSVRVSTREDNLRACRFFERHGFVAVDRRPVFRAAAVVYARIYAKCF